MQVVLGLTETDIKTIRKMRAISDVNCIKFSEKEDRENGLTDEEYEEYGDWLLKNDLFTRMEALIDNQIAIKDSATKSMEVDQLVEVPDFMENVECKKLAKHYTKMISEVLTVNICKVKGDLLRFPGRTFRSKKLLPFDGSSVEVMELKEEIVVFSFEGKHIVTLYKNRLRSK